MFIADANLYLPVSERVLATVLDHARSFDEEVAKLPVPQLAALMLLQSLPKLKAQRAPLSYRLLPEAIRMGNAQARAGSAATFTASVLQVLKREDIAEGKALLADFGVELIDDDALSQRAYLTAAHEWDSDFPSRHQAELIDSLQRVALPMGEEGILTPEQGRIFREIRAQIDEPTHVQGYAGTGKSYLIRSIVTLLLQSGASILVLAERQKQLDALMAGIGQVDSVHPRRYDQLTSEMAPRDTIDASHRRMTQTFFSLPPIPDDVVVRHLGVQAIGDLSARQIVQVVRGTVARFCYSGDAEIGSNHIPQRYASSLDATALHVVLHHATELWKSTLLPPSRDFQPPLRNYHRVKAAALNGWQIPARYTHVLLDECHDLAKPMLQILDSSPQVTISLGDEYQNLQGRPQQRSNLIRQRTVTSSVRSGRMIESVVNPIIVSHPGSVKLPFHGNPRHQTEIVYYDRPQIPQQPTAILVGDTWSLFEWAQRLAYENLDIQLLSRYDELDMFVRDCIELYKHGTRPRHGELFRFARWEQVARSNYDNQGFQQIDRMLRGGYCDESWAKTCTRFVTQSVRGYSLGLVSDVRNREFDSVMLGPDLIEHIWRAEGAVLAAASSAVYVATTRAQRRLIAPTRLRNWIEEISAGQSRRSF